GHHEDVWVMRKLMPLYSRALERALAAPRRLFIAVGVAFAVAAVAYVAVGKAFMPSMDEGAIVMQYAKLPSINRDRSVDVDSAIQRAVRAGVPDVAETVARVGTDEIGLDPMSLNET